VYAQINISSAHVRKSWGTSWVKKEGSLEKSSKSAPSECWIIPSAPWRLDPPSEHQIRKGPCLNPRSPLRKRVKNPTETKVSGCVSLKNDRQILTQIHWIMITHSHHSPFKNIQWGVSPIFRHPHLTFAMLDVRECPTKIWHVTVTVSPTWFSVELTVKTAIYIYLLEILGGGCVSKFHRHVLPKNTCLRLCNIVWWLFSWHPMTSSVPKKHHPMVALCIPVSIRIMSPVFIWLPAKKST